MNDLKIIEQRDVLGKETNYNANELIKVTYDNNRRTTSARDLWEFLDRPYKQFNKWFDKYKEYGFTENQDFRALSTKILTAQGNSVDAKDYEITVDMAKELCMLQKSEKGKIARQYFIDLEKKWNSPEVVMARALQMANTQITQLQSKVEEDKPKVIFAEAVTTSPTTILIRELAKLLKQNGVDIGQNRLFQWLREKGYLIKQKGSDYNMPTQKSMERELFEVKETVITTGNGDPIINRTTKVTGKGQVYFINKFKSIQEAA